MAQIRPELSKKNKFYIEKHAFYAAYHFALQYPEWKERYAELVGSAMKAIDYNSMPHGSGTGDPTSIIAMRSGNLRSNIELIENVALLAGDDIAEFLLYAVTNEGVSFNYLASGKCKLGKIPCGRNQYYDRRRLFYYLLSKKMEEANFKS